MFENISDRERKFTDQRDRTVSLMPGDFQSYGGNATWPAMSRAEVGNPQ